MYQSLGPLKKGKPVMGTVHSEVMSPDLCKLGLEGVFRETLSCMFYDFIGLLESWHSLI